MKISYNLTSKQKAEITKIAIETTCETALQHPCFLRKIVEQLINTKDISDQLETISSYEDVIRGMVSFDPSTGESWDKEGD